MDRRTFCGALALVCALAACNEKAPLSPNLPDPEAPVFSGGPTTQCQLGCNEDDGEPDQPGIFLGSGVTSTLCFNGSQTDVDRDGLSDFCEKNLAFAFSPQLAYSSSDRTGREPKWAARGLTAGKVRIVYALSYYVDGGPTVSLCQNTFPLIGGKKCFGHAGDSELIALDVYYNLKTKHWVLDQAVYSAHEGYNTYPRGPKEYPVRLFYPVSPGGNPRAYVAYQKHANYASDAECDAGALFNTDNCIPDTFFKDAMGQNLNLGSRAYRFQDCMRASNSIYYQTGVVECYWTNNGRFSGWVNGNPASDPYSPRLAEVGF